MTVLSPARPGVARPGLTVLGLDFAVLHVAKSVSMVTAGGGLLPEIFTPAVPAFARLARTVPGLDLGGQSNKSAAGVSAVSDPRDGTATVT